MATKRHDDLFNYVTKKNGVLYPMSLDKKTLRRYRRASHRLNDQSIGYYKELIALAQIETPSWALDGEQKAREFIESIGFTAARATDIVYIDTADDELYERIMGKGSIRKHYYAVHIPDVAVVIPLEIAKKMKQNGGTDSIAETVVHELTHAASNKSLQHYTAVYDSDTGKWAGYSSIRQGFRVATSSRDEGSFFGEALAAHAAGLFTRRLEDPNAPLNSIVEPPKCEKPAFYDSLIPPRPDGSSPAAGYDAYAIEMASWKAHRIGLTATTHTLLEAMYKTATQDRRIQLEGLRAVPYIINRVQPGLYSELRKINIERSAFIHAMERVHDIASKD